LGSYEFSRIPPEAISSENLDSMDNELRESQSGTRRSGSRHRRGAGLASAAVALYQGDTRDPVETLRGLSCLNQEQGTPVSP
jgi:hypothetical protein